MPAMAMVIFGFVAGLFVMTIVNLYKHVLKIMNKELQYKRIKLQKSVWRGKRKALIETMIIHMVQLLLEDQHVK